MSICPTSVHVVDARCSSLSRVKASAVKNVSMSVGAPPPMGKGTGFVYLIANAAWGPSALLIKETRHSGKWGPPGGMTDKTDHSPLDCALREFNEETGSDWRKVWNAVMTQQTSSFSLTRVHPTPGACPAASESWMLYTGINVTDVEKALFGANKRLSEQVNTRLSNEASGYAFVSLRDLATCGGTFNVGGYKYALRDSSRTQRDAKTIITLLR